MTVLGVEVVPARYAACAELATGVAVAAEPARTCAPISVTSATPSAAERRALLSIPIPPARLLTRVHASRPGSRPLPAPPRDSNGADDEIDDVGFPVASLVLGRGGRPAVSCDRGGGGRHGGGWVPGGVRDGVRLRRDLAGALAWRGNLCRR